MKTFQDSMTDWNKIHQETFLFEDKCWTTCSGGFCCSNNHPDFSFQLLPIEGTTLIYLEDEYDFLSKNGKVPSQLPQKICLDFLPGKQIVLMHIRCNLLGKCEGVLSKPLLCKLYPFLPIFEDNGEFSHLIEASIFDVTFNAIGADSPCTILKKQMAYLEFWRNFKRSDLFSARIKFYLKTADLFASNYKQMMLKNQELYSLRGKDFWRKWELAYLRNQLMDKTKLKNQIIETYFNYQKIHGDFFDR